MSHSMDFVWDTGIRGLMRGMTTLCQGNKELLVVRDKVGRNHWAWGKQSPWNAIFSFSALTLLVGRQERHPACMILDVDLLVVVIWLELCTSCTSNWDYHFHHTLLH